MSAQLLKVSFFPLNVEFNSSIDQRLLFFLSYRLLFLTVTHWTGTNQLCRFNNTHKQLHNFLASKHCVYSPQPIICLQLTGLENGNLNSWVVQHLWLESG